MANVSVARFQIRHKKQKPYASALYEGAGSIYHAPRQKGLYPLMNLNDSNAIAEEDEEEECFVIPVPPESEEDDEETELVINIVSPEEGMALLAADEQRRQ